MKLSEAIHQAAHEPDPFRRREQVEQVVTFMRYRLGWTADQCRVAAEKSGVDAEAWEGLLYDLDRTP